jgi:hypothetical protein
MRIVVIGLAACASLFAATAVAGASERPRQESVPKPAARAQVGRKIPGQSTPKPSVARSKAAHEAGFVGDPAPLSEPFISPSVDTDKELAGLSKQSRPEVLTWDRVYALAVVRARSRRGAYAEALVPAVLEAEAARGGVADFELFATLLVAAGPLNGGMAFPDPGTAVLELLRRLQTIENARINVANHEAFDKWVRGVATGESGLGQLDIDLVHASTDRARRRLADEIGPYRNELDELKIRLGLRPRAPVILDRLAIEAFRAGFGAIEFWKRNAQRSRAELHGLVERLPALGEVIAGRQPILARIELNPDSTDEISTAAAQGAIHNHGEG